MRRFSKLAAAALALLACAPAAAQDDASPAQPPEQIALMGTIPIYWGEAADMDELLAGTGRPHWARAAFERRGEIVPIDYLSAEVLAPHRYLVLAQPRGLTPEENVALDAWVRGGGRLLLFADPLMTGESRFGIGDRRRPQDVALLSPIMAHWGLDLRFDEAQSEGMASVDHFGTALPVNMRGTFVAIGSGTECAIPGDGLIAHCSLGTGEALLVADAALLDLDGPVPGAEAALAGLVAHIFPQTGEIAGRPGQTGGIAGFEHNGRAGAAFTAKAFYGRDFHS